MNAKNSEALGLDWLVRLRWFAVGGQAATCAVASALLGLDLPMGVLGGCLAVTIVTNALLEAKRSSPAWRSRSVLAGTLSLDTATLTAMLYWTGGADNPFTAFYLLHVTIAAIALPFWWAWAGVGGCAAGYGILFLSPHALQAPAFCGGGNWHLQGMFVAMVLAGSFIAFFVGRVSASLLAREEELGAARVAAEHHERFASLATLAAGVAHEMATPLGTIAIASKELIGHATECCGSQDCLADARLIRAEVDRCRAVLEKLTDDVWGHSGERVAGIRLGDVPDRIAGYVKPEHFERMDFEVANADDEAWAPEVPLLQSLAVMVKNAAEAGSGRVLLKIGRRGRGVAFSVVDHGMGMAPDVARRVGEPFFTTKEPGQGMGLGLFLVRTFVERVQGALSIDSEPRRGTTVSLFVPDDARAAEERT